ncbi:PadR family transcriptional regulator [Crossiella cryophila]|uniref:DNA-binding PadR family transcriptional regulator n=1 Tax=Crossiella cryophila TaxID=43355 RepID=A0A7W7FXK0_9PSEU|nr:PadR family transcriptional regulator [Crossiella cryophila]MBB4681185.1 DNA-binding PadR family transcriptional regulator [Crossiella cryophila]
MESLSEQAFLVLTALADEPRHGYGLIQEVKELSGDRVQLAAGTLYGLLDRLAKQGLVALDREEVENSRLRRYYRLTDEGAEVVRAAAERMAEGAKLAKQRLVRRRLFRATGRLA